MTFALKILNTALILFALYMGLKQGWAMLSGKPEITAMFSKWAIGKTGLLIVGFITMLGAVLVLFPQTFIWANFITATGMLLIIAFHLRDRAMKGIRIDLPFSCFH
ncbi:hypothetical protein GCM10027592_55330 [Spirosoma flavus]